MCACARVFKCASVGGRQRDCLANSTQGPSSSVVVACLIGKHLSIHRRLQSNTVRPCVWVVFGWWFCVPSAGHSPYIFVCNVRWRPGILAGPTHELFSSSLCSVAISWLLGRDIRSVQRSANQDARGQHVSSDCLLSSQSTRIGCVARPTISATPEPFANRWRRRPSGKTSSRAQDSRKMRTCVPCSLSR